MNSPWVLCITGILFCIGGGWLFYRDAFEENKNIWRPLLVILVGILLITLATGRFYRLF